MHSRLCIGLAAFAVGAFAAPAAAQSPFQLAPTPIGSSCTSIATRSGDPDRVFVLTRNGRVLVIENGTTLLPTPMLDISTLVNVGGEGGALGLAFDPDHRTNGHLYIAHTRASNPDEPRFSVVRYSVSPPDGLVADPASRRMVMPLLDMSQTQSNHLGGWIGFGPDGYLYIARGEGPVFSTVAQDPARIFGKILRVDVRSDDFPEDPLRNYAIPPGNPFVGTPDAAPEAYAVGLRNPWRCAFDPPTGDLWIGDVGTRHEEINVLGPATPAPRKPVNFGYPCFDGTESVRTPPCLATGTVHTPPALEFHRSGVENPALLSTCVTGGVLYRGCAVPALHGRYVYAACAGSARFGSFDPAHPVATATAHDNSLLIYGFGADAYGEVYLAGPSGIYRMMPPAGTFTDCNSNGRVDACEIADGSAADADRDGLPDDCMPLCSVDADGSGVVNVGDIFIYLSRWFGGSPTADFNRDGAVTVQDLFDFLGAYFAGC